MLKLNERGFTLPNLIVAFVVLLVVATAGWYIYSRNETNNRNVTFTGVQSMGGGEIVEFKGPISRINNGCEADGGCSITVDGKLIATGSGMTANGPTSYGNLGLRANRGFTEGQIVTVRAMKSGGNYTLGGCPECYIK